MRSVPVQARIWRIDLCSCKVNRWLYYGGEQRRDKTVRYRQKTGEYLGEYVSFKKSDLAYGKVKKRKFVYASKGLFGGINIAILFVAEKFIHDFMVPKKVAGFDQKEARIALYNFIKENYNTYYNQLERNYKYSMWFYILSLIRSI